MDQWFMNKHAHVDDVQRRFNPCDAYPAKVRPNPAQPPLVAAGEPPTAAPARQWRLPNAGDCGCSCAATYISLLGDGAIRAHTQGLASSRSRVGTRAHRPPRHGDMLGPRRRRHADGGCGAPGDRARSCTAAGIHEAVAVPNVYHSGGLAVVREQSRDNSTRPAYTTATSSGTPARGANDVITNVAVASSMRSAGLEDNESGPIDGTGVCPIQ